MSKTKSRNADEEQQESPVVPAAPQQLDDKTAIEELAERKGRKEELPEGFTKRLDGGHERQITVDKKEMLKEGGKPFKVFDLVTGEMIQTDRIRIEGESESCITGGICGPLGVGIITKAPIIVGRCKKAAF